MAFQYQYGYPNYQQGYQQNNYPQPQQQPQVQNTGILYVDGDKGAEEFQMLPNTFAFLKSTDGDAVYFKQALANGSVTCEKFVKSEMARPQATEYITRTEFDDFVRRLNLNKQNKPKEKKHES